MQVNECSSMYIQNKCHPETRIPAIESLCNEWQKCMLRDPKEVGRLKVGAETLAEVLNKLVDPLSYKAMLFFIVILFGSVWLISHAPFLSRRGNRDDSGTSKVAPVSVVLPSYPSSPYYHGYHPSFNQHPQSMYHTSPPHIQHSYSGIHLTDSNTHLDRNSPSQKSTPFNFSQLSLLSSSKDKVGSLNEDDHD